MNKIMIVLMGLCATAVWAGTQLQAESGWVRAVPPGQQVTAAFVSIKNPTAQRCAIISAQSSAAEKIELHRHIHSDGMMRMRPVPSVPLPAMGQVEFAPGGYHMMMFGVDREINHSDKVVIVLHTDHCGQVRVEAQVRMPFGDNKHRGVH